MALILSRSLGLFVKSGYPKYKGNIQARIQDEKKCLVNEKIMRSTLKVNGAVSNIDIVANFDRRNLEMAVGINVPEDKTFRGKIGWIKNQLQNCQTKNTDLFNKVKDEIKLEIFIKRQSAERVSIDKLDDVAQELKNAEAKGFRVIQIKDLGRSYENTKDIIKVIEAMLLTFYEAIVQYLKNWEKPAPKISSMQKTEEAEES